MRRLFICLAMLCATLPAAARAEWRRAVSTHFILYSEGSDEQMHEAAGRLERFDGLLRRLTPSPPPDSPIRLTVYMPRSAAAIENLLRRQGPAGFYRPDVAGPLMVAPRRDLSDTFSADVVLFHEYLHHFMLQNYSTTYPAWFVEGYAELLSATRFESDGSIVVGGFAAHRAGALRQEPPPLRDLLFTGPYRLTLRDLNIFYANSWLLTHYLLISGERGGQLTRYLDLLGEGRPAEQAAAEAFGSVAALERDLQRYRRATRIPTLILRFADAPQPGPIAIERLGAGEEDLLWEQLELSGGPRGDRLESLAARIRAGAARTPDDPAALQLLADVELYAGNFDLATRAADLLLAARPEAPRALLTRGMIEVAQLERGRIADRPRWTAARNWIRRANRIAPDDPLILTEYYRAWQREGATPPADALVGLIRAYQLVPQNFDLRRELTRALLRERRYREAATVLEPVAYSPHGGPTAAMEVRLIDAIRALPDGADPPADLAARLAGPPPDPAP